MDVRIISVNDLDCLDNLYYSYRNNYYLFNLALNEFSNRGITDEFIYFLTCLDCDLRKDLNDFRHFLDYIISSSASESVK